MYLHNHPNFKDLIEITATKEGISDPYLVEKDYWIMHCLHSLSKLGLKLELKGGTSLSKGYEIIHRFSEDIDIKIEPDESIVGFKVYTGKNHDKEKQRESRKRYFDWLATELSGKIDGLSEVVRDEAFDDHKYRNGGIRLLYHTKFNPIPGLKEGILLEVGFDRTTPNRNIDISSWAFDQGHTVLKDSIEDNRAIGVSCYEPKYTFVEKLQAIVTKFSKYKEGKGGRTLPENFLRHYYDIYCLLDQPEVQAFIGTDEYEAYKAERFRNYDTVVKNCAGFTLDQDDDREIFEENYTKTSALYYKGQISFSKILERIADKLDSL